MGEQLVGLANGSRQSVPRDVAEVLGAAGVTRLLQLMVDAYRDLRSRQCVTANSSENSITEEWFVHIQQRWRQTPAISLIPFHQKEDATKAKARGGVPTIDFCFRSYFDRESYFGAECKLLDEGNATHLRAYLDSKEGIGRFLDGRYGANTGVGAMVGYVRSGVCEKVAETLSDRIPRLEGEPNLGKSHTLKNFDQLYETQHKRQCPVADFLCYHFLFGF